jgi:hypothetical protein
MFVMDMPDVPPQFAPIVVAQTTQAQQSMIKVDRTLGVCQVVQNPAHTHIPGEDFNAQNSTAPFGVVKNYIYDFEERIVEADGKMTILQNPKNGILRGYPAERNYLYIPNQGFVGKDSATILVEMDGRKFKLIYDIHVLETPVTYLDEEELCPQLTWKISSVDGVNFTLSDQTELPSDWLANPYPNVSLSIADLPGTSVGQTTANTITLDIDAAGKMDLLTVLLHENVVSVQPNARSALRQS